MIFNKISLLPIALFLPLSFLFAAGQAQKGNPSALPAAPLPAIPMAAPSTQPASATPPAENPLDRLDLRYANGIVAVAESTVITVEDLRREIGPRVPAIQHSARNEQEFNQRLEQLQEEVIQDLIDRAIIIREFTREEERQVPSTYIDNAIAEEQITRFDNDRSKFLAYLHASGYTMREYRDKVKNDMIYGFMLSQQRKSASIVSPARVEAFYNENKNRFYQEEQVHLRLISLNRNPDETDEALTARANAYIDRINKGEAFEAVSKEINPSAKDDWGWQQRGDLKNEFADASFALKKGEIAKPIIMPEAAYILKAEDRKDASVQSLTDVRSDIERILAGMMAREAEERWLERLRRNAYIRIY